MPLIGGTGARDRRLRTVGLTTILCGGTRDDLDSTNGRMTGFSFTSTIRDLGTTRDGCRTTAIGTGNVGVSRLGLRVARTIGGTHFGSTQDRTRDLHACGTGRTSSRLTVVRGGRGRGGITSTVTRTRERGTMGSCRSVLSTTRTTLTLSDAGTGTGGLGGSTRTGLIPSEVATELPGGRRVGLIGVPGKDFVVNSPTSRPKECGSRIRRRIALAESFYVKIARIACKR